MIIQYIVRWVILAYHDVRHAVPQVLDVVVAIGQHCLVEDVVALARGGVHGGAVKLQ